LRIAHESGALRTKDPARVTVDATVQPKNITFPTDAKLLHAAIKGLNRLARKHGLRLRQSYPAFERPLARANQIRSQQQRQRGWKLYFHAPEVECIGKGKANAQYEFGVKASIVATNARASGGQFVLHAMALPGNPYDGHTLAGVIEDRKPYRLHHPAGLRRQGLSRS
jgi:transposase, IS5 family